MSTQNTQPPSAPDAMESIHELHEALQKAIALGIMAAGSDFENHREAVLQSYWDIMLDYLHQLEAAFYKAMPSLGGQQEM